MKRSTAQPPKLVDRVLLPVDDSVQASQAVKFVRNEFPEAEVVLLHVIDPADPGYAGGTTLPVSSEKWFERREAAAEELLDDLEGLATPDGGPVERVIEVGRPIQTIVEYVEDHDVDHVVVGSHGRSGMTRVLLGRVAETVVRRSPVPVTLRR